MFKFRLGKKASGENNDTYIIVNGKRIPRELASNDELMAAVEPKERQDAVNKNDGKWASGGVRKSS